ncbi:MAG: restriction endonuclease [Candidatus Binatia bacterium]|nr:restriction endonuclease [Candidatus Binatia bacterium]
MPGRPRFPVIVAQQKARVKRGLRAWGVKATAVLLLFVFATILLRGNWLVALFVTGGGIWAWVLYTARRNWQIRAAVLRDVDAMAEEQFRAYAAELLKAQGYAVHRANRSPEWYGDLLLTRGKIHLFCRLYHQPGKVEKSVIVGALAGMHAHGCSRAMVLASRPVTPAARLYARQYDCVLIDRDGLAHLVMQHRQGHRVLAFPREETASIRRRK